MNTNEADINTFIGLIVRGDIRRVREVLNLQPALADQREESSFNTPLHVACSRGKQRNILSYSLSLFIFLNVSHAFTVIYFIWLQSIPLFLRKGFIPIVQLLVSRRVDVNAQDMYGNTALHYACDKGRKNVVEFLVENGSDPNVVDHRGNTPLHNACSINDLSIVHVLLKHGAIGDHLDHANLKPTDKTSSSTIKLAIENFLKSKREGADEELGKKTVNWMVWYPTLSNIICFRKLVKLNLHTHIYRGLELV